MTWRIARRGLEIALLAFLASTVHAEEIATLSLEAISPGDRGYGLTVFQGSTIEKFDVEVVDILENVFPGQSLILIRCSRHGEDGYPIEESGVIGGMSGSPIYIDDKLVGALAYSWSFNKEPLAGVTPIANMLADLERPDERFGEWIPEHAWERVGVRPIATPLVVSGLSPRLFGEFHETFEPFGFEPLLGGGGGALAARGADIRLEPGSAVAVTLLEGDVDMSAVGTVTAVTADGHVLAFGHSFFEAGPVAWPMKTAWIQTVLKSLSRSNKLGTALKTVGLLLKDRQASVIGKLEGEASLIPIRCVVKDRATGATEEFEALAIDHPALTANLVNMALSSFAGTAEPYQGRNTLFAKVSFEVDGLGRFEIEDMYANDSATYNANVLAPFRLLYTNDFAPVRILEVEAELEVVHEDRTAAIRDIALDRKHVRAGESLRARIALDRFGPVEDPALELDFPIPADTPPGPYELVVLGGNDAVPQLPAPRTPGQIAAWIRGWYRANQVVLQMAVPKLRLAREGIALDELPASIAATLVDPAASGDVAALVSELRVTRDTTWVIQGRQSIGIVVEKRRDER